MFGVGTQELLIILLVVLVLFGSKRIPGVARSLGAGLQSFRRVVRDAQREIDTELLREPPPPKPRPPSGGAAEGPTDAQAAPEPDGQAGESRAPGRARG